MKLNCLVKKNIAISYTQVVTKISLFLFNCINLNPINNFFNRVQLYYMKNGRFHMINLPTNAGVQHFTNANVKKYKKT